MGREAVNQGVQSAAAKVLEGIWAANSVSVRHYLKSPDSSFSTGTATSHVFFLLTQLSDAQNNCIVIFLKPALIKVALCSGTLDSIWFPKQRKMYLS